jgi:hypothetical protein
MCCYGLRWQSEAPVSIRRVFSRKFAFIRLFAVKMSTQKPTINSTEANEGNEENTDRRHEDLTFVPFVPFC